MTLQTGYIYQPTVTPMNIHQYRDAATHQAAEQGAVLSGDPVIVYPDQFDYTVPYDMRVGVPLLRWTTTRQES